MLYTKIISLFISFIMLFNLTADIFAQQLDFNTNTKPNFGLDNSAIKRMAQKHEEFKTYMDALDKRVKSPAMYKNEPPGTAKFKSQMEIVDKKLDKLIIESVPDKERAIAAKLGVNFYDFKKALEGQEDVDLGASWREYCKNLANYYEDYTILIRKFSLDDRSYMNIVSDIRWILRNKKTEKFGYEGRDYDVEAYLHACVHNLVTRTTNGYTQRGPWVWSEEEPQPFSLEDKIDSMPVIYEVVSRYGYYPEDEDFLWWFALDIVSNGKKYFDNDTYKADILPGLANADDRQKRDHGKDDRNKQANAVSIAMAILPILSTNEDRKAPSALAIYDLMKDVLGIISSYDYAAIAILTGARALIALDTEDSLSKLLTFLTEDCKKSFAKGLFDFAMGIFSTESWAKAGSRVADKNGGYAYNNSLTFLFTYMDKDKTDSNTAFFAEGSVLENYFNAVYTNIFEEIGRELGLSSRSSSKADSYVTTFASRLSNKGFNGNFSDDDLSASIVVGILDTAETGNTSLNYAADLIYSGAWFDLNEATQRDKNNIAAAYLGKPKKEYNHEKDIAYKQMMSVQDMGKYMDIAVNAVMISTLVASAPAILKGVANITGKAISRVKTITGTIKNVKLSIAAKVSKVTPRTYTGAATTAANAERGAAASTTTAPKAATTAANAESGAAASTTTAPKAATTAANAESAAAASATTAPKAATTAANAESGAAASATTAPKAATTAANAESGAAATAFQSWFKKILKNKKFAIKAKVKGKNPKPVEETTPTPANVANEANNSLIAENSLRSPRDPLPTGVTEEKYASEEYKKIADLEKRLDAIEMEKAKKINNIENNTEMTAKQKQAAINKEESKAYEKKSAINKQIEEIRNNLPSVKKTDARNSISTEYLSSLKGNNLSQDEKIQNLMANSNISEIPVYMDDFEVFRFIRKRGKNIKFNSEADVNSYIKRNSNGKFNNLKDLNKALNPNHPLHNDALSFIDKDPAFKDYEIIISKNTPGYPTLNINQELRIPLSKFIANFSSSETNINIKAILQNNGEIKGFKLDPKHTHGLQLNKYIEKFLNGDVLSIIRKSDHELLIVYDRVKNNNYVIGIIQENPKRGVNLLTTNYPVNLTGLSEQFVNTSEILYLKNPSPTKYNQNAINKLLEDIRKILKGQ